jgi:hypothetical protein
MLNTTTPRVASVGDYVLTASRQVWLAGLGAAVVTRDWAEKEAGNTFRRFVREGTAVESRAIRFVGDRLETSFVHANTLWKRTRRNVTTTVRAYADTAATIVRETLPASLPVPARVKVEVQPAKRVRARKAKPAKRATRRTAKTASKRA